MKNLKCLSQNKKIMNNFAFYLIFVSVLFINSAPKSSRFSFHSELLETKSNTKALISINWREVLGIAIDVGVSSLGDVHIVGFNRRIYKLDFPNNQWVALPDNGFSRVDTQPNGYPVAVKTDGTIWRFNGISWIQLSGCARDIGVGLRGLIAVIGCDTVSGGHGIYTYNLNNSNWNHIPGGGVRIDVGPDDQIWVVNDRGQIYYTLNNLNWTLLNGWASDISVSNFNTPFVIGNSSKIYKYRWDRNNWDELTGLGINISVGPYEEPWVSTKENKIFSSTTNPF